MARLFGTAGARGVTNVEITPELVGRVSSIYARQIGGAAFGVGHDTRWGAEMLARVAASAVAAAGHDAVFYGCIPTGGLCVNTRQAGHAGSVLLTGSHMPPERIGIILLQADGSCAPFSVTDPVEAALANFRWTDFAAPPDRVGHLVDAFHAFETYVADIVAQIDAPRVKSKRFRVCVDTANGTASLVAKELYELLGCDVEMINYNPAPVPARPSEPRASTLGELIGRMKAGGFDLGFGFDVDADRAVFVTEKGDPVSEDTTGALFARHDLKKGETCVVPVNSSGAIEEVCAAIGAPLEFCRIGQPHTIEALKKLGGVFSYEESGKYYFARRQMWCDGPVSAARFLDLMAKSGKRASELVAEIPPYFQAKKGVEVPAAKKQPLLERVREAWKSELADGRVRDVEIDGLKRVYRDHAWLLVRASGTEDLVRVYTDAPSRDRAESLAAAGLALVERCLASL